MHLCILIRAFRRSLNIPHGPHNMYSHNTGLRLKLHSEFLNIFQFSIPLYCNVCETLISKLVYLFIVFGEQGKYIGNINHRRGLCVSVSAHVVRVGPRYKWWQRWDDVNCRTGVALPTGFPGQVSGRNFSEGKVM